MKQNKIRIAIIGASYLQLPLIEKAKFNNYETHVFAWKCDDIGEKVADFFYPISITEKESILERCRIIGIDGICSIASDLASITVNYVAYNLGLNGNSIYSSMLSTNKHLMRIAFEKAKIPSPKSFLINNLDEIEELDIRYPIIVKPTDRSGSRGISKVENYSELKKAFGYAQQQGFSKEVLIEEYIDGQEYSVECLSVAGKHTMLAITKKYTTKGPYFVERAHFERALISPQMYKTVQEYVFQALDSLEICQGASHSELKINQEGKITFIEIGARMGGDCIGSSLVFLSTGVDFVQAVLDISLGKKIYIDTKKQAYAAIRYILDNNDRKVYCDILKNHPEIIVEKHLPESINVNVRDSSERTGYFIVADDKPDIIELYLKDLEE